MLFPIVYTHSCYCEGHAQRASHHRGATRSRAPLLPILMSFEIAALFNHILDACQFLDGLADDRTDRTPLFLGDAFARLILRYRQDKVNFLRFHFLHGASLSLSILYLMRQRVKPSDFSRSFPSCLTNRGISWYYLTRT